MNIRTIESLRNVLCEILEKEFAHKNDLNVGDLDAVHKLTDTIKNLYKIEMIEDGGYSQGGNWEAYGRGNSYANRGEHYVRGHYSRDDGMYSGRDDGRYSRDGGWSDTRDRGYSRASAKDHMMSQLETMLQNATNDNERDAIRRCIGQIGE